MLTFQQNTLVCAIFNFTPAHLSRFPTSFAYFPAIIICICENFPPIVILIRFWYFAPIAICNLPFFTICFARIVCRLYWSHNRAKWAKKKATSLICIVVLIFFFYGVPIFDRWCVKMWDVARGATSAYLHIWLICLVFWVVFYGKIISILLCAVDWRSEEYGLISIAHQIARMRIRAAQNWWGIKQKTGMGW